MARTLFGRLFIASFIILSLFFGSISYIIGQLSLQNMNSTKEQQLRLQNFVLMSSAQLGEDSLILPDELEEPRFNQHESGLYGFITENKQRKGNNTEILWHSYSADKLQLDPRLLQTKRTKPGEAEFEITPHYFVYRHVVFWEITEDNPQLLTFTVLEDSRPSLEEIRIFQQRFRSWLFALGVLLIVILMMILRWGTKPLRKLATNLKQIETGDKQHIEGNYPYELTAVTQNINELIDAERRQRERYHTTLADLAHSLKTPLAVIQVELNNQQPNSSQRILAEQTQRMDEIIKHQLQRAVLASRHHLTESIDVNMCVDRLINAMSKVYSGKSIHFERVITDKVHLKGDQRDLMEVLGNILDNACKACVQQIRITASSSQHFTHIEIHDDGQGIPKQQRLKIIQRGQRADTKHAGQGIGLDVARDIIESYQGELLIEQSPLGGACIKLIFPNSTY
ncbi:MAG: ATP-binding protein [Spongiibacteraceae bacterium]